MNRCKCCGRSLHRELGLPVESSTLLAPATPVGFRVIQNKWGRYEHHETRFLFDRRTEEVYGRQNDNGEVIQLSAKDIETCRSLGFAYRTG